MAKRVDLNQKHDNSNFYNRKNTRPTTQRYNSTTDNNVNNEEMNYDQDENVANISNEISNRSNTNRQSSLSNKLFRPNSQKKSFKEASTSEKFKILMKNPVTRKIILIVGLIALVLLLLIYIIMVITGEDGEETNINSFQHYQNTCSKVKHGEDIMDLEEYVTTVVAGEVTGRSDEVLKTFAIAARTYLTYKADKVSDGESENDCYYDTTNVAQAYHPEKVNERHKKAVEETKGLIITYNGKIAGGHYDAACVYTAEQAKQEDANGNYNNDNYYIKYGSSEIGGIHFQEMPLTDLDKFNNNINYYAEYAKSGEPCHGNHGMGMSQLGAEYLSVVKNYSWKDIIDFYYNSQEEIMTISEVYGSSAEGSIYRQGDPAWGNIPLGNSSTTMAHSGCAVTSIAIGISFSGTNLNVQSFDAGVFINALNNGNCFTQTGAIKWACSAINRIAPSVKYVSSSSIGGDNASKINYINSYPLDRYILVTHFKNSAHARGHYVNFQEFINDLEYAARDPGSGSITNQKISEIDQIVIYSY